MRYPSRLSAYGLVVTMGVLSNPAGALRAAGITDADWIPMVGHSSKILTDGAIYSLAAGSDGSVYAAGRFNTLNNSGAKGVARWDGSEWRPFNSTEYAAAVAADKSGNVYVAIDSGVPNHSAGGVVQIIKKWDGSKWTRLGNTGTDFTSEYLTRLSIGKGGDLFIMGTTNANSSFPHDVSCLARWDGKKWFALDSGVEAGVWSSAGVLDSLDHIYVGVGLNALGGPLSKGIAYWDGSAWSNFETRLDRYGTVRALAWDKSGALYAGGTFDSIGGIKARHLARWAGGAWTPLGAGTGGAIWELASDGSGGLYASGRFDSIGGIRARNIAHWNGERWSALGAGTQGSVALAVLGDGTLYAGGRFDSAGGIAAQSIAQWNGSAWKALPPGSTAPDIFGGPVYACAVDWNRNIYVGGNFTRAGGVGANCIARWNGVSWDSLGAGIRGYNSNNLPLVSALAVDGKGNVYAGGTFSMAGKDSMQGAAKWDGSRWNAIAPDLRGSVQALALDKNGGLAAGGQFSFVNRSDLSNLAIWDGIAWRSPGGGISSSSLSYAYYTVTALRAGIAGGLLAGGEFDMAWNGGPRNIASWNGAAWNAIGPTRQSGYIDGIIWALAEDPAGNLYIGGSFKVYGDTTKVNLARWNGTAWTTFNGRMDGDVFSLACDNDGVLYVGGAFTRIGALRANHIAKWDGFGWDSLGAGVDGVVRCFGWTDSALIVGGGFNTAGGKYSPNLAKVKVPNAAVAIQRPASPRPPAAEIRCRLLPAGLRISGLDPEDEVSLHSLQGVVLYQARGTDFIRSMDIGGHPFIVQVVRPSGTRFVQFFPSAQ